ncbi:MAG: hemolysin III family protein [Treponema sp.]|nr:hemolysin III family protein [Treponema sp.]
MSKLAEKRQNEIANRAVRKSTLKSITRKKRSRLKALKYDYEQKVQEINIQYAEDPERLKAKYAAEQYARNERAKKYAEKRIQRAKAKIEFEKTNRRFSVGEEITSSIIQGIGCCLFIAATAILDTLALRNAKSFFALTTVSYSLFGAAMILMYLFSTLHHALTNFTAKRVFDRLSHVFSFLIIGFTYTTYTITKIQGVLGWVIFGIVWAISLLGILLYSIAGRKFEKLNLILYIISGFAGVFVCKTLYDVLSKTSFAMLMTAAGFYILGIVFYSLKKIKWMHMIGNIIMLCGSIYLFFSLFFINA